MDIRPLYLKDETPQDYALRLFRSLAENSFFDLVYSVRADYARGYFPYFAVLLQDQEGLFKIDRCNEETAFKYLCGDYWEAGAFKIPLAAIETCVKPQSIMDFFDDWHFFFSRIYRENLWDRTTCSAPEIIDFARFDDADYEIINKLYSSIKEAEKNENTQH